MVGVWTPPARSRMKRNIILEKQQNIAKRNKTIKQSKEITRLSYICKWKFKPHRKWWLSLVISFFMSMADGELGVGFQWSFWDLVWCSWLLVWSGGVLEELGAHGGWCGFGCRKKWEMEIGVCSPEWSSLITCKTNKKSNGKKGKRSGTSCWSQ